MSPLREGEDRMSAEKDHSLPEGKPTEPLPLEKHEEGGLIWDEYKYRHDLVWKHLIRSTLALVALVTVRYSKDFNLDPAGPFVTFAWFAALGYWFVTLVVIEPELRLLAKIRNLHRKRQNHCFGPVHSLKEIDEELRWGIELKWGKIFWTDPFAGRVGFYLALLYIATLLAVPETLLR
jgi:hypothetical protein